MARDLKLEVVLAAIDKATAPIKAITQGSVGLARTLKETRETLKGLQSQQKDVGSFRKLSDANKQTRQEMQASTERCKALSQELKNTATPTKALNNEFKRAVREAQALKQKHGEQRRELQGLRGKLNEAGISTRNLGQHERDLRQKIASTNQSLDQQEGRLRRVTEQQQRLAKAKASYEKSQQLAGSMAASGAAGVATGSGILYAGARVMAPGIQFDTDMAKVQALTRLNKDDEQLAAMRAQARQLGADTMFSATEAAQGQGFLAMAGFKPQAILDAMPGMLDIAKAGDMGLAETADIVSNILTGMNMDAGETGRLGDVLVGAFTRSNTNLQMLGETMKYVGPIASSVGQDVETMAAMAGKLGDAGIQGSMGGTALRAIINRLSAPPKAAAKALDQLGVSAVDAQGNMRDMPEVLAEIFEKTKDMGDAERAGILKGIAGEEAVSALQILVKEAGAGSLQEFIETLRKTHGESADTARVMGDNLVGDLDELSSAWEDLGIELQTQQNGPLREIVQSFASIVGGIKSWVSENPELAGTIVKVVAALAALIAAGGAIMLTLASILGPLAMIKYGFAMAAAAASAFTWPILAVIAAIALLGFAAWMLWKNWDGVVEFFQGVWTDIKAACDLGVFGIMKLLMNWNPLALIYRGITKGLETLGVKVPDKFKTLGGAIVDGLLGGIFGKMGELKDGFDRIAEKAGEWFSNKLGIRSPSRVFAALGDDTMAGLQVGLERSKDGPLASVMQAGKALAGAGAVALGLSGAGSALAVDGRPPLQSGAAPIVVQGDTITIQLSAPAGTDTAELERMVNRVLDQRERTKAARIRSALYDTE